MSNNSLVTHHLAVFIVAIDRTGGFRSQCYMSDIRRHLRSMYGRCQSPKFDPPKGNHPTAC